MYGPPVPVMPDEVGQIVVGVDTRDSAGRPSGKVVPLGAEEFRRSIYVQVRRSMPLGMLEPFDVPVMSAQLRAACVFDRGSAVAVDDEQRASWSTQAGDMAARIRQAAGDDPAAQFRRAWLLAFSRRHARRKSNPASPFWPSNRRR